VDAAIAAIAAGQRGHVTTQQLAAAGVGRRAVDSRLADGRLHRRHRGVYLVGHPIPPPLGNEQAAVLACGPGAVLSHRSAARLWGLIPQGAGPIDVTVPGRNPGTREGISVHRSKPLHPRDFRRRHGIPVTAPPRTLLDFAEQAQPRELERAFDEAATQHLIHPSQLRDLLGRSPGRKGTPAVTALLDRNQPTTLTRSDLEEIMLALIRAAGFPAPRVNVRLNGYELDFHWPRERLNVEVDSRRYHRLPARVEHDRRRDAELQSAGMRVIRIGERRLTGEPEWVVARIAHALALSA
jgi:very-short-patch-repair endonuclease